MFSIRSRTLLFTCAMDDFSLVLVMVTCGSLPWKSTQWKIPAALLPDHPLEFSTSLLLYILLFLLITAALCTFYHIDIPLVT